MTQSNWIATAILLGIFATSGNALGAEPPKAPDPDFLVNQPFAAPASQAPGTPAVTEPFANQPGAVKPAIDEAAGNLVESRLRQLESEVAGLRSQLANGTPQYVVADGGDSWSEGYGWHIGYDATVFKFHDSDGVRGIHSPMEFEYEWAPRVWVGYTGPTGVGIRARYWDFDQRHVVVLGNAQTDSLRIDTWLVDMEVTNWMELGRYWSAVVSGGWRYIEYEETRRSALVNGAVTGFQKFNTPNLGGTLSGEIYAHITPVSSLFAIGRTAVVFGDDQLRSGLGLGITGESQDAVRGMWECQLGIESKFPGACRDVFIRLAGEVQYWDGFSGFSQFNSAVGFSGFTGSFGVIY